MGHVRQRVVEIGWIDWGEEVVAWRGSACGACGGNLGGHGPHQRRAVRVADNNLY